MTVEWDGQGRERGSEQDKHERRAGSESFHLQYWSLSALSELVSCEKGSKDCEAETDGKWLTV